jgi:low affinity Fe/Cu permease
MVRRIFFIISDRASEWLGRPLAFIIACLTVFIWAISGPIFHWSDTWQLIINTGTTVVTFLMIFLVQSSQNQDTRAIHIKLDRLLEDSVDVDEGVSGIEKDKIL